MKLMLLKTENVWTLIKFNCYSTIESSEIKDIVLNMDNENKSKRSDIICANEKSLMKR